MHITRGCFYCVGAQVNHTRSWQVLYALNVGYRFPEPVKKFTQSGGMRSNHPGAAGIFLFNAKPPFVTQRRPRLHMYNIPRRHSQGTQVNLRSQVQMGQPGSARFITAHDQEDDHTPRPRGSIPITLQKPEGASRMRSPGQLVGLGGLRSVCILTLNADSGESHYHSANLCPCLGVSRGVCSTMDLFV